MSNILREGTLQIKRVRTSTNDPKVSVTDFAHAKPSIYGGFLHFVGIGCSTGILVMKSLFPNFFITSDTVDKSILTAFIVEACSFWVTSSRSSKLIVSCRI